MDNNIDNYRVMAFDTSKNRTGWAVLKGFKVEEYGIIVPKKEHKKITYKDQSWNVFLKYYFKKIYNIMKKYNDVKPIHFAAIEDLNIPHRTTARILQEIQAVCKLATAWVDEAISVNPIHNMTVKSKFKLTGKLILTKEQQESAVLFKQKPVKIAMIDKINDLYNLKLTYFQDDEADAIALAHTLLTEIQKNLE